ncbi:MAG: YlmH/Sll1252 family protein [Merdibacter sp.]
MDIEFPVCVLKASYQPRFGRLTHRDVLGAFMHQGIDRAQLGDILIEENEIYVMALEPISAYLIDQVTMIRRSGLRFSRYAGVPDIAPRCSAANAMSLRCAWMRSSAPSVAFPAPVRLRSSKAEW